MSGLMVWNPDHYLKYLYDSISPIERFRANSEQEWSEWRNRLRQRFVELLGGFPAEAADLEPVVLESVDCGTYIRKRMQIQTYAHLHMPFFVLIPKSTQHEGKLGAVIACHGHGYGSKDIVGLNPDGTAKTTDLGYQKNFAVELVQRGFITVAPELFGFGDRKLAEDNLESNSCKRLSAFLLAMGQTMAGYRVYETLRLIDYLYTREDVDVKRIGCMGISGGGMVCSFAAALDDRISAAVVSGYANTFQSSILAMHHCIDNYVPGLSLTAELPDLLSLISPKPLLLEAGMSDPIFPVHATREAHEQLKKVYELLGASEQLELSLFEGTHEISGKHAYDWLNRVLASKAADSFS
ncbi:alpha/beta hydrolase family protein [Paenibacillus sp. N5-1-1-5]|uniref:Alpha/beta hydrolase family protein n=2 Tax=Paenibacillus radicis (ex Xue et al. 2023) TaxID=2972489 RepID=A0ABT1YKZ5_9BACL|nr:alpha/beta hydrolase family protein [Paenibacillus radicis (ex Xue et al. 2023)]